MTDVRCTFCLEVGHLKANCPKAAAFVSATMPEFAPRTTADEVNDALAERMHRYRAFAGQLLREMRVGGLTPTAATLALNPDVEDV